ncbi:alkaline phosphatase, partial [Salmonella enterica subsp. enterica serovar Virchow]|nr:alkaline phosphatase [Salmonella enterica subsp. enterica serovar Virchow]
MAGENPLYAGRAADGGRKDSGEQGILSSRKSSLLSRVCVAPFGAALALSGVFRAAAQTSTDAHSGVIWELTTVEIVQAAIFAGVIGSALVCAAFLIVERARITRQNQELRARLADVNADLMRSEALLNLRDQRIVVWADGDTRA